MIIDNFDDLVQPFNATKPFIYKAKDSISLQFSIAAVQSEMCPIFPNRLMLGYTQTIMGFLLFNPDPENIGMIGLGGGSLPKYCFTHLPNSTITVAENNPDVIALSEYFHIPKDGSRFHIICADGADFVKNRSTQYDVLIVDGFDARGQPEQLCTQEFYDDCYQSLSSDGILVINLLEPDNRNDDRIQRISKSFENEIIVLNALDSFNKIVFAFKGTTSLLPDHVLVGRLRSLELDHSINLPITSRSILLQRRPRKIMPFVNSDIRQFTQ